MDSSSSYSFGCSSRTTQSILRVLLCASVCACIGTAAAQHAPAQPGAIAVSEITVHSARISWGAATDPDGNTVAYLVAVRKRIEGVAQAWSTARDTRELSMFWGELSAATTYDVRVRASDGTLSSEWAVTENAFRTAALPDNRAPSPPGAIAVSEITVHSARISWGAATDPDGNTVAYLVAVRKRIEGVAQAWSTARDTRELSMVWGELAAATTYDVRVQATDGKLSSEWVVKETAFHTLTAPVENHTPNMPEAIQITEVAAHSARISWTASADPDGDAVVYLVALRKRIEGVAQPWSESVETRATTMVWDGLASETLFEVRVRATDGVHASNWLIKEHAFKTLTDNNAPTMPGSITVTEITARTAKVSWEPAQGPAGVSLVYEVSIRRRVEGVAQAWVHARETVNIWAILEGLASEALYDVRVRAWAKTVAGAWAVKENAFRTLAGVDGNHPPTPPGVIETAPLTPLSARIAWGQATDPDGDRLAYVISVRRRVEGVAQDWLPARDTRATSLIWEGLSPDTSYDVRVRAADGKSSSDWVRRENAFRTPVLTRLTGSTERPAGASGNPGREIVISWPTGTAAPILEAADDLFSPSPAWRQVDGEVETAGAVNRMVIPADQPVRFFRLRPQ